MISDNAATYSSTVTVTCMNLTVCQYNRVISNYCTNVAVVAADALTYSAMHEQEGTIQLSAAARCPKNGHFASANS